MCLAVPGKVVSIDESNPDLRMAKVNFGGVNKDICIQWLPDVQIGEYILAHVGFALNKVDEKDAEETGPVMRRTAGFLIAHNQHGYVLATDEYDKEKDGVAGKLFIPHGMVQQVTEMICGKQS